MEKNVKKVSVVIVNYNTKEILRDCIKNLDGQYPDLEVVVVDNGSNDGSAEMIEREFTRPNFPWVKLVKTQNNGLAAGNNLGIEKAYGDYLLFLGTDAFPRENTIKNMVDYMEDHKDVGISTAKLVLRDGSIDIDAHRGFPTPWAAFTHFTKLNRIFPKSKLFNRYFLGWKDLSKSHEIRIN